jgi:hypothetical protein
MAFIYSFLVQFQILYLKSLAPKTFWILEFSGFWIFMQTNFNTDKINNKSYILTCALSTVLNLFSWDTEKTSKIWNGVIHLHQQKPIKAHIFYYPLTKQVQMSKLPSMKSTDTNDSVKVLDTSLHLLSHALVS